MHKSYFKKLANSLNQWVASDDNYSRRILIKQTAFRSLHIADRGLNHNESKLLSFGTQVIEAKAIHLHYDRQYGSVKLFILSTVYSHNNAGTFIELRKDGKTFNVTLYDRDDEINWKLRKIKGLENLEPNDLFQTYAQKETLQLLRDAGFKVLTFFRFTHVVDAGEFPHSAGGNLNARGFKVKKNGFEIGGRTLGTYNSLPYYIEVKKCSSLPTVSLSDLGLEQKGYYSHDQMCSVLESEANAAKQFFKKRGIK